jgi:hypothetical protein
VGKKKRALLLRAGRANTRFGLQLHSLIKVDSEKLSETADDLVIESDRTHFFEPLKS